MNDSKSFWALSPCDASETEATHLQVKCVVKIKMSRCQMSSHFYKDILIGQKGLDYNHDVDAIRRSHKDFLQNKSFLCFIYNPFVAPVDYSLFMRKKT